MSNTNNHKFFAGIDVGSTTGKAVIIDEKGHIAASAIVASSIDPEKTANNAMEAAMNALKDSKVNLSYLIGTGYGRYEVPFANENVSEITCHAMGTFKTNPAVRTIIDIGGQDVKAIALNEEGFVVDFVMNDKCAAGTGRFFEAMGRAFQMDLEEFSRLSLKGKTEVPISAQCSVFAESEVISLISRKIPPEDIADGIQASVARRCIALLKRVGMRQKITITGGCAKNEGLQKKLKKMLGTEIAELSVDPQLMGAFGAAVIARQKTLDA